MKIKNLYYILFLFLFNSCVQEPEAEQPYLVVVSMDGFRWDYDDMAHTPTLDSIARTGVMAESLTPSFPSKTFPNHYSLATGLYPDNHGIVLNNFYAPGLDRYYRLFDQTTVQDPVFYDGEPIWATAERQGVKAASYFWVGSEAPVGGNHPTYWKEYEHYFPFEQRIDTVIHWLSLPEPDRPHLVMLYFHEPDHIGHVYGPTSDTLIKTVEYLDHLIGILTKKLNTLSISEKINLIVLSDHGMHEFDPGKICWLDQHIDTAWFDHVFGWNPNFCLKAKPEFYDTAFSVLSSTPNIKVWKHGEVPARLNYGNNPRTQDFIVLAEEDCAVMLTYDPSKKPSAHGYDNRIPDMGAIFYGTGPAFKEGYVSKPFENIHIYSLLSEILRIQPANVDGSIDSVRHLLDPGNPGK